MDKCSPIFRTIAFLLSLLCLASGALFSQSSVIDSLFEDLNQATQNNDRWEALKSITEYYIQNNPDSAKYYADQCLLLAEEELPEKLSLSYVLQGAFFTEFGEMEKASEVLYKALDLSRKEGCLKCRIEALNELFVISHEQFEFENALGYLRENLEASRLLNDSALIGKTLTNLSLVFGQIPQNDSAEIYAYKAIEFSLASNNLRNVGFSYNNLAIVHENKKEYDKAIEAFKKVIYYARLQENKELEATGLFNVASSNILSNQLDTGMFYLQQFRAVSEELKKKDFLAYYYDAMSEASEKKGDYKKAFEYFKTGTALRDSLQTALYSKNLAEADTKFKTSEKEAQLVEQNLLIEKQSNQRNQILIGGILLVLLLAGIFQYLRYRSRIKRKETELALQLEHAESEKLREMDQLRTRFFANISHEFRTPLTLIKGPLQNAEQALGAGIVPRSAEVSIPAKYIRMMRRNADRLLQLVNQLLDLSKIEAGSMKLEAGEGDIVQFVKTLAASFESMADQREIRYAYDFPKKTIPVYFDKDKLEKALTNLLSNAFKFTPEEGKVKIFMKDNHSRVSISVEDSGIGISKNELSNVFDRFYSRDSNSLGTSEQGSTGIGLALTKELVELHRGTIAVESILNKGSRFTITLPLGKAHLKGEEIFTFKQEKEGADQKTVSESNFKASHQETEAKATDTSTPLVLVVEDNEDVRTYITDQLRQNYQVLEAVNGRFGLETALEKVPDLIISDVMMPEMDGFELCEKLKTDEKTSHIPVILLTARADQSDRLEGLETGADDYLTKPFDAQELQIRVRNLIAQRRKLRERYSEGATMKLEPSQIAVNSADEIFLKKAISIVEDHIDDESFSVEDLAAGVFMSRYQLLRKLKALTGQSISVFIRTLRLQRAHQLLEKGAGNPTEISYDVGFSSPAYFSKCFRDHFGKAPSEVVVSK